MRSGQTAAGFRHYTIIGFYLYDVSTSNSSLLLPATSLPYGRGLTKQDLTVATVERVKSAVRPHEGLKKTRGANEEYLFSNIRMVDVSVTNLFTRQTFTLPTGR